MARTWTDEERAKQAEVIRRVKPWERSTGPRTKVGKKRSSMNAKKPANLYMWDAAWNVDDYKLARLIWRRLWRKSRARN